MRPMDHQACRMLILAVVCFFAVAVSAQVPTPANPPMTSTVMDKERDALYARFLEFKRNRNPEQQQYAYPTAKEYLLRWGGERDLQTMEVRQWVIEYERAAHARDLFEAYDKKNYAKLFEIGRQYVKADPDYYLALALLTEAAYDNSVVGKPNYNLEAADYARKAIELLEAGKITKPDPFKSLDVAGGFLNFALGTFVGEDKPVEAAIAFKKAAKADSPFRTEASTYHRLGVSILRGGFAQLSAEYNQKFGGKPPSSEQTAMLTQIQLLADQAIDAYARAVALSTRAEQSQVRAKILGQLTALYKSFHNDSEVGLHELIATVLSKPMP